VKTWTKVAIGSAAVGMPAFLLSPALFSPANAGGEPTAGQIPFFLFLAVGVALLLGLGVSFRLFGFPVMRKVSSDSKFRAWAMLTTAPSVPEIDVDALLERRSDALVLDVREPGEYARHGHVPGAINVPQADLASRLDELPRDRPLLTVCRGGVRSLRAGQYLKQAGFGDVASVKGGTEAWRAAGNRLDFGDTVGAQEPRSAESGWAPADAS
jgi:rhodanese-related sulfurtransferase